MTLATLRNICTIAVTALMVAGCQPTNDQARNIPSSLPRPQTPIVSTPEDRSLPTDAHLPSTRPLPEITNAPEAGSGAGGPGSLTVAITEPVAVSGHVNTQVTCTTSNRTYEANTTSATIQGYQVAISVRVSAYRGPGNYLALVTLILTGTPASGGTIPGIPTTITDSGGSVTIKTTGANGYAINASIQWACS